MAMLGALRSTLRQHVLGHRVAQSGCLQQLRCFAAASNQMALIKELRERTGAPISDVKNALQAADWDLDKAVSELRKKGLAAASKKASRHAAEGLVGVCKNDRAAAVVEVNSETDFVARNEQFLGLVGSVAAAALQLPLSAAGEEGQLDLAALKDARVEDGSRVEDAVVGVAGAVRENIRLRRAFGVAARSEGGLVGSYLHTSPAPGMGRIAGLVSLESEKKLSGEALAEVQDLCGKLAMHVVGAQPRYFNREGVPEGALEAERQVLTEQALKSGKPANIVDKMVAGRLNKFYEEWCLLEQRYILDDSLKVRDVVAEAGKKAHSKLQLGAFVRVQVGEGLETEQKDFAAEVAETLKSTA